MTTNCVDFPARVEGLAKLNFDPNHGIRLNELHPERLHELIHRWLSLCIPENGDSKQSSFQCIYHVRFPQASWARPTQNRISNDLVRVMRKESADNIELVMRGRELFGFVKFRQTYDPTKPRNCTQNSLVLFVSAPRETSREWCRVPLEIVNRLDPSNPCENLMKKAMEMVSETFCALPICEPPRLIDLLGIWEHTIAGTNRVFVCTDSADQCSSIVQFVVDFVEPLRYSVEYCTYMSVSAWQNVASDANIGLIGVTNPYFLDSGDVVFDLRRKSDDSSRIKNPKSVFRQKAIKPTLTLPSSLPIMSQSTSIEQSMNILKLLTHEFMVPFENYLTHLMPSQKSLDYIDSLLFKFDRSHFASYLKKKTLPLSKYAQSNRSLINLYLDFQRSKTFDQWLNEKQCEIAVAVERAQLFEFASNERICSLLQGKDEVSIIDALLTYQKAAIIAKKRICKHDQNKDLLDLFEQRINQIKVMLPSDLKNCLQRETEQDGR